MKLGIIGLPNTGKSALFNALTRSGAESASYPFSTVTPNIGVVQVPDARLKPLEAMYKARKITPASIEFVDIAGLVKGAGRGEGLGNRFLSFIREADALVHVIRCFEDPNIAHADPVPDPRRDAETISFELIFADLEIIERRLEKSGKPGQDKSIKKEHDLARKLKETLEAGHWAKKAELDKDEAAIAAGWNLLTLKPVLYAANVSEGDLSGESPTVLALRELAGEEEAPLFTVCAKIEEETALFDEEERMAFLKEMGVGKSGLDSLITASYSLLGLISFFTAGVKEARAWTIKKGTKAQQAAGKIHSDLERGFIRAETVNFDDLTRAGSYAAAKDKGMVRLEGKEYIVRDGDVILFRFNV